MTFLDLIAAENTKHGMKSQLNQFEQKPGQSRMYAVQQLFSIFSLSILVQQCHPYSLIYTQKRLGTVKSCLYILKMLRIPAGVPVVLSIVILLQHLALTGLVAPLRVVIHQEIRQQACLWVQAQLMLQHCNGGVHNLLPLLCTLCVFLQVQLSNQQAVTKPIAPKQSQRLMREQRL